MQYSFASPQDISAARDAVLGRGELRRISDIYGEELIPVEEVLDAFPGKSYSLELPASSQPILGDLVHFGAVVGGTIDLSTFTRIEDKFVDFVMELWEASERTCLAEVAYELWPAQQRVLNQYFPTREVQQFSTIVDRLRQESKGIIATSDKDLVVLLLRMGLREIARNVLVFPKVGLAVRPFFDLRVAVIQGHNQALDARAWASRHGLSLRPLGTS